MKLKQVITKSYQNPRYLWYIWQNKRIGHIMRNHFPIVRILRRFKALELGHTTELKKLHVILRTTDQVMNISASRLLEDIGIITKNDIIRTGGCTLFKAASYFSNKYGKDCIRLTLVMDRLSEAGKRQYYESSKESGMDFDVVEAKGHGNGPTFQTQIDVALQDDDDTVALILEDDYMLSEEAFAMCFQIMQKHSNVIGMNPHYHPDRIRRQDIGNLAVIDGHLFSQVYNTCCTFFISVQTLRRYERWFRVYDGFENGSINTVWGKGICLAPLGWTLAEHLHRSDLSPQNALFNNHEDIY